MSKKNKDFNLSRKEFRKYLLALDQNEIVNMAVDGGPVWACLSLTIQYKRMVDFLYKQTLEQTDKMTDRFNLRELLDEQKRTADEAFKAASTLIWRVLKVTDGKGLRPPEGVKIIEIDQNDLPDEIRKVVSDVMSELEDEPCSDPDCAACNLKRKLAAAYNLPNEEEALRRIREEEGKDDD